MGIDKRFISLARGNDVDAKTGLRMATQCDDISLVIMSVTHHAVQTVNELLYAFVTFCEIDIGLHSLEDCVNSLTACSSMIKSRNFLRAPRLVLTIGNKPRWSNLHRFGSDLTSPSVLSNPAYVITISSGSSDCSLFSIDTAYERESSQRNSSACTTTIPCSSSACRDYSLQLQIPQL